MSTSRNPNLDAVREEVEQMSDERRAQYVEFRQAAINAQNRRFDEAAAAVEISERTDLIH